MNESNTDMILASLTKAFLFTLNGCSSKILLKNESLNFCGFLAHHKTGSLYAMTHKNKLKNFLQNSKILVKNDCFCGKVRKNPL